VCTPTWSLFPILLPHLCTAQPSGQVLNQEEIAHKGGMRTGKKPPKNKIAFDVLNAKELMQKL
jgi:hypothetical protein